MAHGVVRTDRMFGTDNRAGLISVKYMPTVSGTKTATDIDNGNVVLVGDLITGEREVFEGSTPTAAAAVANIALIATPEVMYDERLTALSDFYNEAGKIARGYLLHSGDIFSLTIDCFANTAGSEPEVGDIVEVAAGTKLLTVESATSGSTAVGKVIEIDGDYYVIKVD